MDQQQELTRLDAWWRAANDLAVGMIYPDKSQDRDSMERFFKQFSFPGHIGSHCTPETPRSIHEGVEHGH